ncbi:hypothetical protein GCM10009574_090470 [Streptomyces asiaticus]
MSRMRACAPVLGRAVQPSLGLVLLVGVGQPRAQLYGEVDVEQKISRRFCAGAHGADGEPWASTAAAIRCVPP